MCTANAIEMLAATRTPSRFVEEVRRDDPLTAECVGGHSRTLAQRSVLAPQPTPALQTPRMDEHPKPPISCRRALGPTG